MKSPPADKCAQCDLETLQLGGWQTWCYHDHQTYFFCSSACLDIWKHHVDVWEKEHEQHEAVDEREDRR